MQKGHVGLPLPRSIKGGYRPGLLKWLSKTRIHGCEKKGWLVGHGQWDILALTNLMVAKRIDRVRRLLLLLDRRLGR